MPLDNLKAKIFEGAVAVTFLLVGITYVFDVHSALLHSPIAKDISHWAYAWSVLYLCGSPLLLYGIIAWRAKARIVGLLLLGTGALMQGIAAVAFVTDFDLRIVNYFIYAAACGIRAHVLIVGIKRR